MEKFITATGKTIDLAIAAALEQLGMDRDSVSVEVLENPRSGFLGIGSTPAKVKAAMQAKAEGRALKPETWDLGCDLYERMAYLKANPLNVSAREILDTFR